MARPFRSAADIAGDLSRWFQAEGTTQHEVAARLKIAQPQLSRILSGQFTPARSAAARKLCSVAGVSMHEASPHPGAQELLYHVINQVWDGSEDDAERLAALLRAAHRLRQPHSSPRQISASHDESKIL